MEDWKSEALAVGERQYGALAVVGDQGSDLVSYTYWLGDLGQNTGISLGIYLPIYKMEIIIPVETISQGYGKNK